MGDRTVKGELCTGSNPCQARCLPRRIDRMDAVVEITELLDPDEEERKLRLRMLRDAGLAWKSLSGLAQYGMTDDIKLEACKVMLAYTIGLPTQRHEVNDQRAAPRAPKPAELNDKELQALKTLRDEQKRRALESGE